MRTVFAVIPAAGAVESAVAAFKALPVEDNARLVGLHVAPLAITYGLAADMALASYIETQLETAEREAEEAGAAFARACEGSGIAYEWRAERAPDNIVSPHAGALARAADIVLAPQLPEESSVGRHRLEEVVFSSGRPVIALPTGWAGDTLGSRVLVAWDGGREATRAVFDALPILSTAEAVKIVSVEGMLDDPVRQFTPGDDVASTLSRHGVKVETASVGSHHRSVKEELDAQAREFAATLMAMGCYGHSRIREQILGGVSRGMLRDITLPLLLSN